MAKLHFQEEKEDCVCEWLHNIKILYMPTVDEDRDVVLERIENVNYCPICGTKLTKGE